MNETIKIIITIASVYLFLFLSSLVWNLPLWAIIPTFLLLFIGIIIGNVIMWNIGKNLKH